MKKVSIILLMFMGISMASAQHYINPFFDEKGSARISTEEYSAAEDTIVKVFHRSDDVIWSRYVYRIIDLRQKQNFQLYFPVAVSDPDYRSLFKLILDAVVDGLPIYYKSDEQGDIKPYFDERYERLVVANKIPELLNVDTSNAIREDPTEPLLIKYDSVTNKLEFNSYMYTSFIRNQYKYLIQEIVFFDRHTSRLYSKIMAIAPLWTKYGYSADVQVIEALYDQVMFWVAFDDLRPYMARQFVIPSQNETKRVTYDEFFQKHLYSSYIVGDGNMYNRLIIDKGNKYTPEEVKREQARIEKELLDFEQDLWEY